jgi:hypothetical protein
MPKICYKIVQIRHKFVRLRNPEKIWDKSADFRNSFYKITIVERILTGKLPTGIFSTDKVK